MEKSPRRCGYVTAILAIEAVARQAGAVRLGLNVNVAITLAISPFKARGYAVVAQQMANRLR